MIRQKKNHQKNCWWCECLQHSLGYNSWEFQWSLREVDANLPSISRENGCSASLSSAGKSSSVMQESFSVRKAELRRCSGTNLLCSAHVPTAPTAVPSQLWLSLQEPTSALLLWAPGVVLSHQHPSAHGVCSGLPDGTARAGSHPVPSCTALRCHQHQPGCPRAPAGLGPLAMEINSTHCQCILKGMRML